MQEENEIINKLKGRFATKIFDKNFHIDNDFYNKIEDIFNLAPTSFGLQPFKLVKISSKQDRETIKKISWNQQQVTDCALLYVLAIETDVNDVLNRYERMQVDIRKIESSKAVEYSEFVRNFLLQRSSEENFYESWATRQAYLALGFFISTATVLNIDTAPLEGFEEKELDKIFDFKKYKLNSKILLCIGKKSVLDEYPKLTKIRKSKFDLILHI